MTNLSMVRLCMEVEQNLARMPDKYFQQLRSLIEGEHRKRRALVEGEDKVWVNMSPQEQKNWMHEKALAEVYEDWARFQEATEEEW